jgi:hypothetical protein
VATDVAKTMSSVKARYVPLDILRKYEVDIVSRLKTTIFKRSDETIRPG